jgi:hypothetical protein
VSSPRAGLCVNVSAVRSKIFRIVRGSATRVSPNMVSGRGKGRQRPPTADACGGASPCPLRLFEMTPSVPKASRAPPAILGGGLGEVRGRCGDSPGVALEAAGECEAHHRQAAHTPVSIVLVTHFRQGAIFLRSETACAAICLPTRPRSRFRQ